MILAQNFLASFVVALVGGIKEQFNVMNVINGITQVVWNCTINYEVMGNANISWTCCNCGVPNFSTSLFSQWSLETSNSFSSLSNLSNVSVGDDLPLSPPVAASSPKNISSKSRKPKNQTNKTYAQETA